MAVYLSVCMIAIVQVILPFFVLTLTVKYYVWRELLKGLADLLLVWFLS